MNFRVLEQRGLDNARSPFRVVEDSGPEVEWVNRFLDQERVRSVARKLRYAAMPTTYLVFCVGG